VLWPAREPWPECDRHSSPFVAVLQLRSDDFPEMPFPAGTDLFQLLWCPFDHEEHGYGPAPLVFWRRRSTIDQVLGNFPIPIAAEEEYLPIPCSFHPERITEYPSAFELTDEESEALEQWEQWRGRGSTLYQYELSSAPGFKIGGYVDWCQDPEVPVCECGSAMEHLLTIDSAEFDGGSFKRWCPIEDRHVWTADYFVREPVQCPAGIMLGDMGGMYIFVCRNCEPWRNADVTQCS
jgi:hypothetical protein